MKYKKMLKRAYESLPEKTKKRERFEMPKLKVMIQGNKTIVSNFWRTIKMLHRNKKHALKYFTGQVASSASLDKGRMVLKGAFSKKELQSILEDYVKKFVLCNECLRPDTKIVEQKGVKMLKCEACGALSAIRE